MDIDYDMGEDALKRAEEANKHIAAGTVPEGINDDFWCESCAYQTICMPEHIGKEVEIDTSNLGEMLDRLSALKSYVAEYDEIDDLVKKMVEGREKLLAGQWFVTGKWMERKAFSIAASKYWRRKVVKVDEVKK